MTRHALNSSHLAPPVGPFSHAVHTGDEVYLSGQVGQDPATGTLVAGGILEQTRQIFSNIRTLLDDLHLDFDKVIKVTVFLANIEDFAAMNEIYAQYFSFPYPARTTVAVKALPMGALVEMEMIVRGR